MRKTKLLLGLAVAAALGVFASTARAASTADVLFVVDESGSMAGEHAWIANMVTSLDTALGVAGVTGNQYGLVGFGASNHGPAGQVAHKHPVGGADFGTAAQMSAAAGTLSAFGGLEDGYQAISYALNNYTFRADAALNVILITDEDRDIASGAGGLNSANILAALQGKSALLNAVVNGTFTSASEGGALGTDGTAGYYADGSGGFVVGANTSNSGYVNTVTDYVNLAIASGGAAWDLNQLRAGGLTAQSFTAAFVDIKVQEIIIQPPTGTPDGGSTLMLLGAALAGFAALRRKF
jgi:hypothetical protein